MTRDLNRTDCIREMIAQRLKSVAAAELRAITGPHIDEDAIAAFVEGRLTDTECTFIVAHLALCALCRRVSAQFVQLENQIDDEVLPVAGDEEPGRLEALLSRLGLAAPDASEEVVFAYEHSEATNMHKDEESRSPEPTSEKNS